MIRRLLLTAVLVAMTSLAAQAQTVKVEFAMGTVNVVAQNASVRAILTEWSRVGGTRLVNPQLLTGGPVTLELIGVPERQALDIILRDVGGYMLGPRPALVAGVSSFDRLVVVTAVAGRPAPAGPAFPAPRPLPQPQLGRAVQTIEREPADDVDVVADDLDDDGRDRPEGPTRARPAVLAPALPPLPRAEPQPEVRPTPGNPFGVQGSSRPGAIAPVQPTQQPPQPGSPSEQQQPN